MAKKHGKSCLKFATSYVRYKGKGKGKIELFCPICKTLIVVEGNGNIRLDIPSTLWNVLATESFKENLEEKLLEARLRQKFTFNQGNNSRHAARTMEGFRSKHIHILKCSWQSLFLNPFGVMWRDLTFEFHRLNV